MRYSTNLTKNYWQFIKNILEYKARKRKYFIRDIVNSISYLVKISARNSEKYGIVRFVVFIKA